MPGRCILHGVWTESDLHWKCLIGFLPAKYEEDNITVQEIGGQVCSGQGTIRMTSELVLLENFTTLKTVSEGHREKRKAVHKEMQSILDALCRRHDEWLEVTTSISSCWRLVSFVVSNCCDIPEGENMSGQRHETKFDRPCIRCLLTREQFCNVNGGDNS